MGNGVRKLSLLDTLRVQLHVGIASIVLGVVVPRRRSLSRLARRGRDIAAMRVLHELRARYGEPFWGRFPVFRRTLVVLAPATVDAVLRSTENSPDPPIKTWPVSRWIPDALVVSSNADADAGRRKFNTAALDLGGPLRHAETFAAIAIAEAGRMIALRSGSLRWRDFESLAQRISHQVILGAGESEPELARHLARMLRFSNWFVRRPCSFAAFYKRVDALLRREPVASSSCLMHGATSGLGAKPSTHAASQVGFWFFVLKDIVELHVSRTLALIAAHPEVEAKVRDEVRAAGTLNAAAIDGLHYLGACIEEGLRLWTPVPLLLRRADRDFVLPDGTAIQCKQQMLIHAGFYHRDPDVFKDRADAFLPDAALGAAQDTFFFSAHDRGCAGRTLAMFLLKATLASLLARFRFELAGPGIQPGRIAYYYDHFRIDLLPVPDA